MAEREVIDACLKVVSNRCRNLRKAIDRAKTWEQAAASGQELNPEQMESVKSCVKKEALLAELQEILKKQTTIVEPPAHADQKQQTSKRSAKAARAKEKRAKAVQRQGENNTSSADGTQKDDDSDLSISTQEKNRGHTTTTDDSSEVSPPSQSLMLDFQALKSENESLRRELDELNSVLNTENAKVKKENVRKVLNLFHVVDFLRQSGSREALLSYSQTQPDKATAYVTQLDMDLLCYFNVMLTSPNGNVPHDEAVDVSTSHCLEFLQNSKLDAFKDTSYASLNKIVDSIATSPILTERGRDELANAALYGDLHDGLNGNTPGYEVSHAKANVSVP
ncbi:hypothetical protein FGB62_16g136 [Gracilaria domingensis]|nr:hypothetical protein FGB62_16g136 [Gracilaria domingensis]